MGGKKEKREDARYPRDIKRKFYEGAKAQSFCLVCLALLAAEASEVELVLTGQL